ncbi:MAG: hypothetical protein K9H15_15620 [Bacteroidales bacterium]|nr:hypothetical protein [Bacteroidales bacterium]MCF8352597.1 hypothetical protein [Bacteroidales bacterium]
MVIVYNFLINKKIPQPLGYHLELPLTYKRRPLTEIMLKNSTIVARIEMKWMLILKIIEGGRR